MAVSCEMKRDVTVFLGLHDLHFPGRVKCAEYRTQNAYICQSRFDTMRLDPFQFNTIRAVNVCFPITSPHSSICCQGPCLQHTHYVCAVIQGYGNAESDHSQRG